MLVVGYTFTVYRTVFHSSRLHLSTIRNVWKKTATLFQGLFAISSMLRACCAYLQLIEQRSFFPLMVYACTRTHNSHSTEAIVNVPLRLILRLKRNIESQRHLDAVFYFFYFHVQAHKPILKYMMRICVHCMHWVVSYSLVRIILGFYAQSNFNLYRKPRSA